MSDQKNRAPRYTVDGLNVVYDVGDAFWSGPVVDFSESGLFVETTHELPVDTEVTLVPDVPSDESLPFELTAKVVRVREYDDETAELIKHGIAFLLINLSEGEMEQVREFLAAHGVPVRAPSAAPDS
jgi:hypothetical protein